ncbi:hypothetical protein MBLNU230_g8404t1 [Neophaeotheca triangularis]
MASRGSYDYYTDSRPRSSRRSESYQRPSSAEYRYDPRYQYPSSSGLLAPEGGRHGRSRSHSRRRKRHPWPPAPLAEDEAASLAKEAGTQRILKDIGKDAAISRGSVDQEPIIEEVPGMYRDYSHVVVSDDESVKSKNGLPTPPTSEEDEKARRGRRRPSRLYTDFNAIPDFTKRTSSPYAFSKPSVLPKDRSSGEFHLSPDTMTPPPSTNGRRDTRYASGPSRPTSSRKDSFNISPGHKTGNDYLSAGYPASENAIDDSSDIDKSDASSSSRRRPSRYSRLNEDVPHASHQTAVHDFATQPPGLERPSIRRVNLDSRRHTETTTSMPMPRLGVDKSRKPTPLMASSAGRELDDTLLSSVSRSTRAADSYPPPRSRESSYSSRPGSPVTNTRLQDSPPRSPKLPSREDSSNSSPTSRAPSADRSRPSTSGSGSATSRLPPTDLDWTTLMAANAARRSKPPSRLSAEVHLPSGGLYPRSGPNTPNLTRPMPYPEDVPSSAYMPSERDFQYFPEPASSLKAPLEPELKTMPRTASPAPASSSVPRGPKRPSLATRHTLANVHNVDLQSPVSPAPEIRHASISGPLQTHKELEAMSKKALPNCRRRTPVRGYDDWMILVGAPGFVFCPDCISSTLERTVFRPAFRRSPPHNLDTKLACAFGNAWVRLAWLLTLHLQKPDLGLIRDLANIEGTSEPCPGDEPAVRTWFGLRYEDGRFVHDFQICYTDVRKIERLLPTLNGLFVPLPARNFNEKKVCGIEVDGDRFSTYLDALIDMHDESLAKRKLADPWPFIKLVERKTMLRECEKDTLLLGALWHYIPSLPAFTVCENCFDAIVEPEIAKGKDLAMRFNRTLAPHYGEGPGSSCQIYSKYMQRVFRKALEENDVRYLARRAGDRRDAEMRLQERKREVWKKMKRLDYRIPGVEDENRRLRRELQRIQDEWKDEWE